MTIKDVMTQTTETVHLDLELAEVRKRMDAAGTSAIVALDGTRFSGVVTKTDLSRNLEPRVDGQPHTVRDLGPSLDRRCDIHDSDEVALGIMDAASSDWLAVFNGDQELQGLVSRQQIRAENPAAVAAPPPPEKTKADEPNPGLRVHSEKPSLKG